MGTSSGIPKLLVPPQRKSLEARADSRLERRADRDRTDQDRMLRGEDGCNTHATSAWPPSEWPRLHPRH